jgi:pSer/pThr/pTyr-binding forkhead associated (FHA) protein
MITERGPHGTINVVTIESEKDVVLYALDVLQNRSCPHFLPVYLREQLGSLQLCIDCTGLICLSDPGIINIWPSPAAKKIAIADLLFSIPESLDLLLEPSGLSLCSNDIWADPVSGSLFFTYLPVMNTSKHRGCFLSSLDIDALESLLMDSFFLDDISEDSRHMIISFLQDDNEAALLSLLDEIRIPKETPHAKSPCLTKYSVALIIQLSVMIFSLICIVLAEKPHTPTERTTSWLTWYLIIFSTATVVLWCAFSRSADTGTGIPAEKKMAGLRKSLLFPDNKSTGSGYSEFPGTANISPAFLTEQTEYGTSKKRLFRRSVIWTDDFLIGSDPYLCDFCVQHSSVSDRHARIVRRNGVYYLLDLGSAGGTYVSHRKLYSHEENPLTDNDIIRIGDVRFLFIHKEPALSGIPATG